MLCQLIELSNKDLRQFYDTIRLDTFESNESSHYETNKFKI
jgi:hypothetical protein